MPKHLYVHITWATLDRAPMIGPGVARFLRDFLPAQAHRCDTRVLALGLVSDHVHLLVEAPAQWDLPRLMMGLKGASSHAVNADSRISTVGLRWEAGYDARTVGPGQLRRVIEYVKGQPQHHHERAIRENQPSGTARIDPGVNARSGACGESS